MVDRKENEMQRKIYLAKRSKKSVRRTNEITQKWAIEDSIRASGKRVRNHKKKYNFRRK